MVRAHRARNEKSVFWVGSARKDLIEFPEEVKDGIGMALSVAQFGGKHPNAKPWKGEGSGVFEVVEDHRGNAYRTVYTVRFEDAIYVLHAFQKKSPRGIKTSRSDVALVGERLRMARRHYDEWHGRQKS